MRILHLLNHCQDVGNGIVNCAVDLAAAQADAGHTVAVASGGGEFEPLLARHQVTHHRIDQRPRLKVAARAIGPFRRLLDTFKPDVVHSHMMTGILLARGLRFGRSYRIVSHVHNIYQRSSVLMGLADRVIVVSSSSKAMIVSRGVRAEKVRVVLNGIVGGARRQQQPDPVPASLQHPAIVTVAGMSYRKGIAELIEAFDKLSTTFSDAHLYLVGDGPDRWALEKLAAGSHAVGRIHFEGFQRTPQSYMAAADLFVLASRRESFPLVLLEAREMGCPVLTTDVDGCAEAVDFGNAGRLVKSGDVDALSAAMSECLADESVRADLRVAARRGADQITVRRMTAQVMDVYDEATTAKNARRFPAFRSS